MPMIPAFCDNCGTAFSSGIAVNDCMNVTLSGNKAGPCPECGAMGRVIDGVFNASAQVLEVVSAPYWTYKRLEDLAGRIQRIQQSSESPEEKTERFKAEVPEIASISDVLPKTRNELYAALGVVIAAISVLLSQCDPDDKAEDREFQKPEIQYVVNAAADRVQER